MVSLSMIGSALATVSDVFKSTTDVMAGLKDLQKKPHVETEVLKKTISDLLDRMIRIQGDQMAIQSALIEFQKREKSLDDFEAQAGRYALVQTDMGAFVRELKVSDQSGEPIHCLCTACYNNQVKSILGPVDFNTLGCPECGAKFLKSDGKSTARVGPIRKKGFDGYL